MNGLKCRYCHEMKSLSEFYWDRRYNKPRPRCKECARSKLREYRAKNPGHTAKTRRNMSKDAIKEMDRREYLQKRKQRKRIRQSIAKAVRKAYPECCACGSTERLGVDHILPVSEGGSDDWDNLQTLCATCNSRKRFKIIDYRDPVQPDPRV